MIGEALGRWLVRRKRRRALRDIAFPVVFHWTEPCPVCGGQLVRSSRWFDRWAGVVCLSCGMSGSPAYLPRPRRSSRVIPPPM